MVGDGGGSFSADTNSTAGQLSIVGKNSSGGVSAISRLKSNPDGSSNQSSLSFETRNSSAQMVEALRITSDQNVLPGADNTQDLGSTAKRWANVYSGDVHLNNTGMGGNEIDGSEGHWTMQEGSDDLFLINRITGKKYKFNLTEVS